MWTGPGGDGPQGGVTQSLLGRFLSCRERFRRLVVDGWRPADRFEPRMEFGNLWHAMEEALAGGGHLSNAEDALEAYTTKLLARYPMAGNDIVHWAGLAGALFPEYVRHWAQHPDVLSRTPLLQEQAFDVPYRLPSGRVVRLRGKWDAVDLIGAGKDAGVYVQENKTKSTIDGVKIARQVAFDLQSMFYLVALEIFQHDQATDTPGDADGEWGNSILGVRYNVIRRPAHKTVESAMKKFGEDQRNGRVGEWFARWKIEVGPADVARFRRECLDPILENLLDDYEWWGFCGRFEQFAQGNDHLRAFNVQEVWDYQTRAKHYPHHRQRHFRTPYFYNPIAEGGYGDVDALMDSGSTAGLTQTADLFPELA